MSGSIDKAGAGSTPISPTGGGVTSDPSGKVSSKDKDEFSRQVEEKTTDENEQQKDELLELMKKHSFNEFNKQQKERLEEIKKDLE